MKSHSEIKILDHGYLKHIESWGSDERIIEAARMSTDKGFLGWGRSCSKCGIRMVADGKDFRANALPKGKKQWHCDHDAKKLGDEKLLAYLYTNKHMTPFEMAGMIIEVQAPIFVFREWHRHRTQSYNELSARYTPLPDLNYIPTIERVMMNAGTTNKQAGTLEGSRVLDKVSAKAWIRKLRSRYEQSQADYTMALEDGVPKELARVLLPVGRYSRMRASANLRNWLAFLTLRDDPAAQWEIRQYASHLSTMIASIFPRTHTLYRLGRQAGLAS